MAVQVATDNDFKSIIEENNKVVVKYFADWCGSCKLLSPKFRRLSEDETYSGIKFLDVNAEENEEARKLADVNNLPFIAVFENGKMVAGQPTSKEDKVKELIGKIV